MEMKENFEIPWYVEDEFYHYYSHNRCFLVWENVKLMLNIARVNKRLTQEQIDYLIEKYK